MKVTVKGSFITGNDFYEETSSNKKEFIFVMNKIMNNTACNWPSSIECEGRVPRYVMKYFSEDTETKFKVKQGDNKQ